MAPFICAIAPDKLPINATWRRDSSFLPVFRRVLEAIAMLLTVTNVGTRFGTWSKNGQNFEKRRGTCAPDGSDFESAFVHPPTTVQRFEQANPVLQLPVKKFGRHNGTGSACASTFETTAVTRTVSVSKI